MVPLQLAESLLLLSQQSLRWFATSLIDKRAKIFPRLSLSIHLMYYSTISPMIAKEYAKTVLLHGKPGLLRTSFSYSVMTLPSKSTSMKVQPDSFKVIPYCEKTHQTVFKANLSCLF